MYVYVLAYTYQSRAATYKMYVYALAYTY